MRVLRWVPWLLLAVAVGVAGWLVWDTVAAVREANEERAAVVTANTAVTTSSSAATTSTSRTAPTSTTVAETTTTTDPTPPYTTFNWGGKPAEPGLLACEDFRDSRDSAPIEGWKICYAAVFVGPPYVAVVGFGGETSAEGILLPVSTELPDGVFKGEGALFAMLASDSGLLAIQSGMWLPFDPENPSSPTGAPTTMTIPVDELMTSFFRPDRLYPVSLLVKVDAATACGNDQSCFMAWGVWYKHMVEEYNAPLVECLRGGGDCSFPMDGEVGLLGAVYVAPDYNPAWLD